MPNTRKSGSNKPRLAGGNTIQQAQKPSRSMLSLPATPFTHSFEDVEALKHELEQTKKQLLACEEHRASLAATNDRLRHRIVELQAELRKKAA